MSSSQGREGPLVQGVYYLYAFGSVVARALPERPAYGLAQFLGGVQARISRKKKRVVAENLSRVTGHAIDSPELDALVVAAFRSYARYWLETFRLVRQERAFFLERVACKGEQNLDAGTERGVGVIAVVGHLGNYDAAGAWAGATGRTVVTVAEVLRPRRMFEFFAEHRGRLGITIYPAERGVTSRLADAVSRGSLVAILGDRDLRRTGPRVEFFGKAAHLPAGPASIALRTGAPVVVAGVFGVRRDDGRWGWDVEVGDPIHPPSDPGEDGVRELTQQIALRLEEYIARRPEEWHVFQPFWDAEGGS